MKSFSEHSLRPNHSAIYSIALSFTGILCVAGGLLFAYVWHWQNRPHVLEIYCFIPDTTSGSISVFIRTPQGKTALIDGGPSDAIIHDLTSVMPFYDRTIDTLILTNDDDSHAAGLVAVLGRYHVEHVFELALPENIPIGKANPIASSSAYGEFENILAKNNSTKNNPAKNIIHEKVGEGDAIRIGELSADIIFPPKSITSSTASSIASSTSSSTVANFKFSKTNAPTLAFSLTYGSTTLFFGGLITKTEQKYIAIQAVQMEGSSSTILILPKGENVSTVDETFFDVVHPDFVVVSKKPKKSTATTITTTTTTKTGKAKKPPKPPFDISIVPNISIVNIAVDGSVEFISNGSNFVEKKL